MPKRLNTDWATLVGYTAATFKPESPWTGPITFQAKFFLPRPKSAKRGETHPLKRPDVDNLVNKLTDKLNGVFYEDDSQVVWLTATKEYAVEGRAGVEISVAKIQVKA